MTVIFSHSWEERNNMADNMNGLKRTHYCGEVTEIGGEAVVCGFVERVRE